MRDYECALHVNKNIKPVYQKMRRHPIHLRDKINKETIRLEQAGIIESVTGPQEWVSNLVATPKSDQSVRLCLDARAINTDIERETHPIPTLESIMDDMSGSTIFTHFHTLYGIKRFKRLCYGINNAFSKYFKDHLIKGHLPNVKCISDDIIIYNTNYAEHIITLEKLFAKIKELGLRLNKRKCVFAKSSIAFFGVIISADGVKPDPIKIESIQNATPPQNVNELRSFLGLSTYLSRFIDNFSSKTAPLRILLKKDAKFV